MPSISSPSPTLVNDGQIVSIVTWILLVASLLAVLARLCTKWAVSKTLHVDDGFAVAALLCHIGSGIAVSVEDRNGLGSSVFKDDSAQAETFAKSSYAADLLFIATLSFAKVSMILLFNLISQQRQHRQLNIALGCFTTMAFAAFFLAGTFPCQLPKPWDVFSRCYDRALFWYTFGVINILTDMVLVVFPVYIMAPLQMSMAKKFMVLSCFGTRFFDVAATAVQLRFVGAFRSARFSVDLWPWVLISQFVQCITVITSCVPYLKPLLESFPSGMFMSDEIGEKSNDLAGSDRSHSHVKLTAHARFASLETSTGISATATETRSEDARLWEDPGVVENAGTVKTTTFYTT